MLLEYSWPMRWNSRSAPLRSTRTGMPGNFASNDLATRSAADRSIEVYQTTLPSFLAASIRAGVIGSAGGAAALIGEAKTARPAAPAPLRTARRDGFLIAFSLDRVLSFQPVSARQRSGGRCSHTDDPCATFSSGEVTTRSCVPSAS